MSKLRNTCRIVFCLFMARTFGRYVHSTGGPAQPNSAIYEWRGRFWSIPTEPLS